MRMRKWAAPRYNPRIGQLIVDFLEYFRKHEEESADYWDFDEALEYFGESQNLKPVETYQVAMQLYSQGYPIDPVEFHPDHIREDKQEEIPLTDELSSDVKQHSIFDEYRDAIMRQEYEKAHIIFESMTPSQKQVIRDRRAKMNEKLNKKAQEETAAALEKDIPVAGPKAEDIALVKESPMKEMQELQELIGPAEDLVENHHSLNLPPQSMTVFLPFAHALDEFKHARDEKRLGKVTQEDVRKKTQNFLASYGKVLNYLDTQGFDVVELENLLKQYANVFFMQPTANLGQRLLALATNLQKKGMPELARSLMVAAVDEGYWREFENAWAGLETPQEEKTEGSPVEEASKIMQEHLGEVAQFLELLKQEKYDEARAVYLGLSPEQRTQANKLAQQHFAATNILSLHKVGESLFNKGKYVEAHEITQIIKAQFAELPMEGQKEVILLILPAGEKLDFLPQAFDNIKNRKERSEEMCGKMEEMKCRLNPFVSAETISRILKLADNLDEKGQVEFADKITAWIETEIKQAQQQPKREVGVFPCPVCKQDIFFDKSKGRPQFCTNCGKGIWGAGKVVGEKIPGGLAKGKADSEFDPEQLEKGIEIEYEHTPDKETAKEIAKDHLTESKDYYKYLEKMENKMDKEASLPGPYEPYQGPLAGAAKEKLIEKQHLSDPRGVSGKPLPSEVVIFYNGKPVGTMPRLEAVKLMREKKLNIDSIEGVLQGTVLDPSILRSASINKMDKEAQVKECPCPEDGPAHDGRGKGEGMCEKRRGLEEKVPGGGKRWRATKVAPQDQEAVIVIKETKAATKDEHGGKPAKVVEIADAIRRDNPEISDAKSYAMAWETFCSYVNPGYEGCTEKGKSERESPKPYTKARDTRKEQLEMAKRELTKEFGDGEWNEWGVDHPDFQEWLDEHKSKK